MVADGSIAVTSRSGDSYEPAPAPTFTTVRASPSARSMAAAMRGSVRRVAAYAAREASYSLTDRNYLTDRTSRHSLFVHAIDGDTGARRRGRLPRGRPGPRATRRHAGGKKLDRRCDLARRAERAKRAPRLFLGAAQRRYGGRRAGGRAARGHEGGGPRGGARTGRRARAADRAASAKRPRPPRAAAGALWQPCGGGVDPDRVDPHRTGADRADEPVPAGRHGVGGPGDGGDAGGARACSRGR